MISNLRNKYNCLKRKQNLSVLYLKIYIFYSDRGSHPLNCNTDNFSNKSVPDKNNRLHGINSILVTNPVNIGMFKVNIRNTRKRC